MKGLLLGIAFIILVGIGGLVYRNAIERPVRPIACPIDALICPDGTAVARTESACTFAECPPPNVALKEAGISFAIPAGFSPAEVPDAASVAAYDTGTSTPEAVATIVIRRYGVTASSTALETIRQTAVRASGQPVGATAFSSTVLGTHRFTVVAIERSGGLVDTAYYLARGSDVLRFEAIDRGVLRSSEADLNVSVLPAHAALASLLASLQVLP